MNETKPTQKPSEAPLSTLKRKRQVWVFPVLVALVVVAGTLLVLIPQIRAITDARDELQAQEEQLDRLVTKRQQLESLSEAELSSNLVVVTRALPNEKPISQALGLLMTTTEEFEVTMSSYAMDPGEVATQGGEVKEAKTEEKPGALAALVVETELAGVYQRLQAFLSHLEAAVVPLTRSVAVEMKMEEEVVPREEGAVTSTTTLEVAYAQPLKTIGKASDPLPQISQAQQELLEQLRTQYQAVDLEMPVLPQGIEENKANIFQF